MAKLKLETTGFTELYATLSQIPNRAERATEQALLATHDLITKQLQQAIAPHRQTGKTQESLKREGVVRWKGSTAEIGVGFDIGNGGLASIFLMYGTPTMQPDRKLYQAIYGAKTKKRIAQLQEQALQQALG